MNKRILLRGLLIMEWYWDLQYCLFVCSSAYGTGDWAGCYQRHRPYAVYFVFHYKPGTPPIGVMLTILAVVTCAGFLQTSGGLTVMLKYAEISPQ